MSGYLLEKDWVGADPGDAVRADPGDAVRAGPAAVTEPRARAAPLLASKPGSLLRAE